MAESATRHLFGIHSVSPYNRSTGLPYGNMKCIAGATFELTGELVKLEGGAYSYAWGMEDGYMSGALTFKPKQYEEFMIEVFLGKAPTATSSDSGSVTTLTNKSGTTVSANTGIGSVGVTSGSESELKYGKYIVKAVSSSTVDVYALSDADFSRGTDEAFEDDALKITPSPLTITQSATTTVSNFGFELLGGSGTISLTSGETAEFFAKPPSSKSYSVTIGGVSDRTPEFGAFLVSEPRGNGEMFSIDVFRCRAIGLPINLEAKAWSEAEIKAEALYDAAEGGVCSIRSLTPNTPY